MASWKVRLAMAVGVVSGVMAGGPQCRDHQGCAQAPVLLQTQVQHETQKRRVTRTGVSNGDKIFLTVPHSSHRIAVEPTGDVQAKWNHKGSWQELIIEKAGEGDSIVSGDSVFLIGMNGNPITVENATYAHAHSATWEAKETFKIFKMDDGAISYGDKVFLGTHLGTNVDADAPGSAGIVQARFDHTGWWQELVIEDKNDYPLTDSDAPTTEETTTQAAATAAPTTVAPTTAAPEREAPENEAPSQPQVTEMVNSLAWEHFQLINDLRASGFTCPGGKVFAPNPDPLKFDCKLWMASKLHSEDMVAQDYFSHTSADGRSPWARAEEQGTSANAENIAAGRGSAQGTLDQFKNSDGHCMNMLAPGLMSGAVGYAPGGTYGHYWTQMFSTRSGDEDTSCYPAAGLLQQRRLASPAAAGAHHIAPAVLPKPWTNM